MNRFVIIFFLLSINAFSQFPLLQGSQDEKTFNFLNRPSTNNKLSKYLKANLNFKEIRSITDFSTPPNIQNSIRVRFQVNQKGLLYNFRIYTGNNELNKKVKRLLKNYLTDNIPNLKELFRGKSYLQLFSKKGNNIFVNASSVIVTDYPPVFKYCSDIKYSNAYGCFKQVLKNFVIRNVNLNILADEKFIGELILSFQFEIDKHGKIIAPLDTNNEKSILHKEIERLTKLFQSEVITPSMRNNIPYKSKVSASISLFIDEKLNESDILRFKNSPYTTVFKNSLSEILFPNGKRNVDQEISVINNTTPLKLFFNYKKNGKLDNVWTDTQNKFLSNKIITTFKRKVNDTLKIDRSFDRINFLTIIRIRNGHEQILCDDTIQWLSRGTFTKCDYCQNAKEIEEHNVNEIADHIIELFNLTNNHYKLLRKNSPHKLNQQHQRKDNLFDFTFEVSVNKKGKIIKSRSMTRRYSDANQKEKSYVQKKNTPPNPLDIQKQIEIIIDKLPNYISKPLRNNTPIDIKLTNLSFEVKRK